MCICKRLKPSIFVVIYFPFFSVYPTFNIADVFNTAISQIASMRFIINVIAIENMPILYTHRIKYIGNNCVIEIIQCLILLSLQALRSRSMKLCKIISVVQIAERNLSYTLSRTSLFSSNNYSNRTIKSSKMDWCVLFHKDITTHYYVG